MNGIVTCDSFVGRYFSSAVVWSTEFGIIHVLPLRSRTTVCRQVTSVTVPVTPEIETTSPGCSTCENISWKPPIVFAIESLRPSEIAKPPMPSAVNNVTGLTPKTGLSTIVTASVQMRMRARLMKIDAFGICERRSTLSSTRDVTRAAIIATTVTTTTRMILPLFARSQFSTKSMTLPKKKNESTAAGRRHRHHTGGKEPWRTTRPPMVVEPSGATEQVWAPFSGSGRRGR